MSAVDDLLSHVVQLVVTIFVGYEIGQKILQKREYKFGEIPKNDKERLKDMKIRVNDETAQNEIFMFFFLRTKEGYENSSE